MNLKDICVNTLYINNYLDEQDKDESAITHVYDNMVGMFRIELEEATCIEDVYDDLSFELNYLIERDAYDIKAKDVLKRIYSDYNLKGAK